MATVTVANQQATFSAGGDTEAFLRENGVDFEVWPLPETLKDLSGKAVLSKKEEERVLKDYSNHLEREAKDRGYIESDMIVLNPETPGIEEMLARFDKSHYHDDDEVRFIFDGEGIFGFEPEGRPSFEVKVTAGDYIIVPAHSYHWFTLTDSKSIKAIRLFKDKSGWVPYYRNTES